MFACSSPVMGAHTLGAHTLPERSSSSFEHHSPAFFRRSNMPQSPPLTGDGIAGVLADNGNYEELSLIGNGSYGTVYKARDRENPNKIVALKKVRVPLTDNGVPLSTLREIALLKQVDQHEHPNIVRLLDVCHGPTFEREQQLVLYLVFEHVDQDMATYIERCPPPGLGGPRIKDIMFQLLSGVDFLHSHRIVHRDLKPQNLLVTNSGNVKLADFGLAKTYDFEMRLTSVVVTLWYRSPEVLLGDQYATQVDLWSCGCIMAELFRRTPIFCGQSEVEQLDRIFQVLGTPPRESWPENVSLSWTAFQYREPMRMQDVIPEICPEGKDVLEKMLRFEPHQRISAADALRHPYFANDGYTPMNGPIHNSLPRPALLSPPGSLNSNQSGASDMSPKSGRSSPSSLNCSTSDESGHSAEK